MDKCWFGILFTVLVGCTIVQSNKQAPTVSATASVSAKFALLSDRIHDVTADKNNIWVATDKGINRFIKSENRWMSYTVQDGLANNKVLGIAVDRECIWFGTESGISKFKITTGAWTTYNRDNGLPSNRITAVSVDGNYVWFGTDKGLARYNMPIDVWALRTTDDGGLPSNQIIDIAVEEEYVWFATDKSLFEKSFDSISHQVNGSDVNHSFSGLRIAFIVQSQSTKPTKPRKCALNNPS